MPGPISDLAARMWDGTELPIDPLRATVSRPPVAADGLMGPMNEHVDDQTAYEHFIQVNDARTTMVFVMAK